MTPVPLTCAVRPYVHVAPMRDGSVTVEGVDLSFDEDANAVQRVVTAPEVDVGEISLVKHLIEFSGGERSIVALPVFVLTSPRHRCFYVKPDSPLRKLTDLRGCRIGTEAWQVTGNTWARAVLHWEGVAESECDWSVGPVSDPRTEPGLDELPHYARHTAVGESLVDLLVQGELDALLVGRPPKEHEADPPSLRRLLPDFIQAEKDSFASKGFIPAHHLIGIKRSVLHQRPWLARNLLTAFGKSREISIRQRLDFSDASPWILGDLEDLGVQRGRDWQPIGVRGNHAMVATLCHELHAQAVIDAPLDPADVFAEFEQLVPGT